MSVRLDELLARELATPGPLPSVMPSGRPWPLISIVTPTRNQGETIEATIRSVLEQGYPAVEHIVVDGASTDGTAAVLERYRDRLARVISEPDRGQSDAINKGMRLARGEIVGWLNSDDMLAPGALAAAAEALDRSGADVVSGVCLVHRGGALVRRHVTACGDGPLPLRELLDLERCWLDGQFFYQPEVLLTRRIWERAGGHVREDLYYSMDYELWLRLAEAGARLKVIGRPIALFREHPAQKTAQTEGGGFRGELPAARARFLADRGGGDVPAGAPAARRRALRVALLSDMGHEFGAGIGHRRVALALAAGGHEVLPLALGSSREWWGRATAGAILETLREERADLLVVGNIHGLRLEPEVIAAIAEHVPCVLYLHDMWWLTGGCAYAGTCDRFRTGCGVECQCPPPRVGAGGDPDRAWVTKRAVLSHPGVSVWTNSKWLRGVARRALEGIVEPARIQAVGLAMELDVLKPMDRRAARAAIGVEDDRLVVLASATSLDDPRKGMGVLLEAMERSGLRARGAEVVAMGRAGRADEGVRALGYVDGLESLARIYAGADVVVAPSTSEALGQVVLEAAACGRASVGFAVGGVPEAIEHGVSGVVVPRVDAGLLAEALAHLAADRGRLDELGFGARRWAEAEWSPVACARRVSVAMRESGLWWQMGLGARLDLSMEPPAVPMARVLAPSAPGWRSVSGLSAWREMSGGGFVRVVDGSSATIELVAESGGALRVIVVMTVERGGVEVGLEVEGGEVCRGISAGPGRDVVLSARVESTQPVVRTRIVASEAGAAWVRRAAVVREPS